MKNDLSCEVVRDLMPSYLDGVASGETKAAVERHMEECPDCRETLRRMKEPEDAAPPEEKEIDYLKKVRRRSSCKVAVILGIVVLLSMAAMFRLFYIGFPVDSRAIAAVVTVRDGTVRLTGTLTDSGQSVCRANITQNEDGGVEVQMYAALPLFAHSGDFTWEYPAAKDVTSVSVNGLVLWENGEAIDSLTARLYEAKNPYVGDMSANANIASLLRIENHVGSFTNELQTDAEPYGWTLLLNDPIAAENEKSIKDEMRRCSCVLLAEIENLGTVSWKYETDAGEKTFTVTASDASKLAGQDIKTCAVSASELQNLLNDLGF